jgi:hypothetical protein
MWAQVINVLPRYELTSFGTSTLVLLHDPGLILEEWDEVVPAVDRRWRILRHALRGMRLSEKEPTKTKPSTSGLMIRVPTCARKPALGGWPMLQANHFRNAVLSEGAHVRRACVFRISSNPNAQIT